MTAPPPEIAGLTVRKLSIGTLRLLHRTGNSLFGAEGELTVDLNERNVLAHFDDILSFLYIHSALDAEVIRACHGPRDVFEQRVSEFAMGIEDMDCIPALVDYITGEDRILAAARVDPDPDDDERDEDPNACGQAGMPRS